MSARDSPNLRCWGEEWGGALDMARRWKIECFEFAMEGSYWTTITNVKRKRIPNNYWIELKKQTVVHKTQITEHNKTKMPFHVFLYNQCIKVEVKTTECNSFYLLTARFTVYCKEVDRYNYLNVKQLKSQITKCESKYRNFYIISE